MLNRKERERYIAIIRQLSDLSLDGWIHANSADWQMLERELAQLSEKRNAQ